MDHSKPILHAGVLGMKWGRRMDRSGNVTTLKRGKRVPTMTTVRGNKSRSLAKQISELSKTNFGFV